MTLTCPRCTTALYPATARRTDEGWAHSVCPPATCGECGTELPARNTSGYCRPCYNRLRWAERLPEKPTARPRPCPRCGIGSDGLCDDCIDVAADLGEVGRWAA